MTRPEGWEAGEDAPADRSPAVPREGGTEVLGSGNLDQVREILFGAQSRTVDRRLARLEEDLPKRLAEIREEIRRSLTSLETYARTEIDSLNDRLRAESEERTRLDEEGAARLEEAARGLRKDVGVLAERTAAADRELRQQLLDQAKRLEDEIQRRVDDLAATLARAVDELRNEKADRKAVAGVLHEVAMRLTDELSLPRGDGLEP